MTASLMPLLGIAPRLGRNFTPAEDLDGTAPVAILSDGLWRRRFGADEHVVGRDRPDRRRVAHDRRRHAARRVAAGPARRRRRPLDARASVAGRSRHRGLPQPEDPRPPRRRRHASNRRPPSSRRLPRGWPPNGRRTGSWAAESSPSPNRRCASIKPTLLLIAGSVGLLLLVASANASTLLLARASNRRHEIAVRDGARRDARAAAVARRRGVAGVRRRSAGWPGLVLGGWALRAVLPLFAGLAAGGDPDRHRRARRRLHRRDLRPSSGCCSASSSPSTGRTAAWSTC